MFPDYTPTEQLSDGIVHVLGLTMSVLAVGVLLYKVAAATEILSIVAAAAYGAGLLAMLGCSAAYNLTVDSKRKETLRRYDHAAIYVMIAGTYTPFAVIGIAGVVGYSVLAFVWLGAAIGVVVKLCWPRRFERASLVLYLTLGWTGLVILGSMLSALPISALAFLGVGGILYTAGVPFHLWTTLPYHNAIWHGSVLAAASCHYVAVFETLVQA